MKPVATNAEQAVASGQPAAASKPNFLFIFTDDQAPDTVGAWGNPHVHTPNMDRLAARGINFRNAYNPGGWSGAVCVPSRTQLNTARYLWSSQKADTPEQAARGTFWSSMLKKQGYTTYMTGKWHLKTPAQSVYDHVVHVRPGMPRDTKAGYNRPIEGEDDPWDPADPKFGGFWEGGKHWSEVLADDAEAFIAQAAERDEPFFMYLAFNAPHDPRQSPQRFLDMYPLDKVEVPENYIAQYPYAEEIGCPPSLRDEHLAPFPRTEYAVRVARREYYALVSHTDEQIGRILDALEKSGKADNTWIIFTADHGLAVGRHGLLGKQNSYEHSVRVPFIIVPPKSTTRTDIATRIYHQDVVPTTLELAGATIPDHIGFRSLVPLIRGETKQHYEAIHGAYVDRQRMIIVDDWKLLVYPRANKVRLYHLATDPLEMKDLAADPANAPRIRNLLSAMKKWQAESDDELDLSVIYDGWL